MAECNYTMSGQHMYTPKQIGSNKATAHEELRCLCGVRPHDLEVVKAQLEEVASLRKRLARESLHFLNKLRKQQEAAGVQPRLPF